MMQTPSKNAQNCAMCVAGNKPEPTRRDHEQAGDDAAFVAELDREPARRDRHQEVAEIMRELHPGRLRQIQMQLFLKMLVHHVDHAVAESPKRKQQDEEEEGEDDVAPVFEHEHPRRAVCGDMRAAGAVARGFVVIVGVAIR